MTDLAIELPDVLSGDAGLAGVRWLLLDPRPRRVLRGELAALLADPKLLGSCRLRRVKFKPGRKLTAYYDVDLRGAGGSMIRRRPIAVAWRAEGTERPRSPSAAASEIGAEAAARGLAEPFRDLQAAMPGWGMQLLVSPLDVQFPHLPRLSDPTIVAEVVNGTRCRVMPIRYRPGQRHVLRYDFERRDGARGTVYAKLYKDELGERAFAVAAGVADWVASNSTGAGAIQPTAYLGDSPAVLYPAVTGISLRQHFGQGGDFAEQLRRAGALLRTLHRAPLTLAKERAPYEFGAELRAVARASEHVRVLLPGAAARVAAILDLARELYDRLPKERPVLTHGDFKLDHLWASVEGLVLIDHDRCCIADPAFDIGKLLADLHWWHLLSDRAGMRPAQRHFLDGYGAEPSSALVLRARVYEAVLLVKIAARRVALFDRRWEVLTESLIARGEAMLADLEQECRRRVKAAGDGKTRRAA